MKKLLFWAFILSFLCRHAEAQVNYGVSVDGPVTPNDCVSFVNAWIIQDAGAPCGGGGGGGTVFIGTSLITANPQLAGDATTGLYTAGAAEVDVTIGGSQRLSITSTTTTAIGALSVTGNLGVGAGSLVTANGTTGAVHASGALDALTFNKVTITAPATGSTLTIANGKTLTVSNTLTFTGTDSSSVAFGSGGTVLYGNQTITLTGAVTGSGTTAITTSLGSFSSANLAAALTDETGTGVAVFGTAPTISSAVLGASSTATTQAANDNSTKLATTQYVDSAVVASNPAVAVKVATTAAGDTSGLTYNNGASGIGATFTGSVNTALTIDGVTLTAVTQRVLVKNDTQSPSGAFNGVYTLTQLQTGILPPILTRALDYDQPSDINNTGSIPVVSGTVNAGTSWLITSTVATVGTDPLTYTQFSYALASTATLNTAQTFTAAKTFTNSDIKLLGSSTGATTFTSANAGAPNFTLTFPAVTDTLVVLGTTQAFTASQAVTPTSLTISTATFTPTFATSNTFQLTLVHASCPCTLANPSGTIVPGTDIVIEVKQSSTGSDTIGSYGGEYKFSGGTAPTLSTGANVTDMIVCHVSDATHLFCGFNSNFAQ